RGALDVPAGQPRARQSERNALRRSALGPRPSVELEPFEQVDPLRREGAAREQLGGGRKAAFGFSLGEGSGLCRAPLGDLPGDLGALTGSEQWLQPERGEVTGCGVQISADQGSPGEREIE